MTVIILAVELLYRGGSVGLNSQTSPVLSSLRAIVAYLFPSFMCSGSL